MRRERGGNGKNGSKWIRPEKRLAIYHRDGFRCVYCGSLSLLTLDHVIPRSRGGSNDASNLVTSCLCCNAQRQCDLVVIHDWRVKAACRKPIDIAVGKELLAERRYEKAMANLMRKASERLDVSDVSDTDLGLAPK